MDIHAQKLDLIEQLLKINNEGLILKVKALLDFAEQAEKKGSLSPMSLESFYQKILDSEEAIVKGEVIPHTKLREQTKGWKRA